MSNMLISNTVTTVRFIYTDTDDCIATYTFPLSTGAIPHVSEGIFIHDIDENVAERIKQKVKLDIFEFDYFTVDERMFVFDREGCTIEIFVTGQYLEI